MNRFIQLGTKRPKSYLPVDPGEDMVLSDEQPELETSVNIDVSPDSQLMQAVAECKEIWGIHTHEDIPLWIGYNSASLLLATILSAEYGGNIELRDKT